MIRVWFHSNIACCSRACVFVLSKSCSALTGAVESQFQFYRYFNLIKKNGVNTARWDQWPTLPLFDSLYSSKFKKLSNNLFESGVGSPGPRTVCVRFKTGGSVGRVNGSGSVGASNSAATERIYFEYMVVTVSVVFTYRLYSFNFIQQYIKQVKT